MGVVTQNEQLRELKEYKYGFRDPENYVFKSRKGLDAGVVVEISRMKGEPEWMLEKRLKALDIFLKKPMPQWGGNVTRLDLDDIYFYTRPTEKTEGSWDDVPDDIKNTFERLGIPEAERKFLAGVGAQYECLSGDTGVYTARGVVPIKNIQAGDVVFSLDEESDAIVPRPVRTAAAKGERAVFEVKVGTRVVKATENHPFLVLENRRAEGKRRGRYVRNWKHLRDIRVGDLVAVARSLPDVGHDYSMEQPGMQPNWRNNPVRLPTRSTADLMWWLGLYIGDGFIHRQGEKARVEFAIPETDQPLRTEFKQVTSRLFDVPAQNGDPYRLTVGSTIVARFLEVNGFLGGALEKRVPDWVASLPQEQILAFIGGYVDADGYVRNHARNKDVFLTSANIELLQDVRDLAAICGVGASNIHRFEGKHPHDKNRTMVGYRMMFSGDFERIGCRSDQRLERFGKRKFHHSYSSAENTSFRKHVNDHFGYARVESITPAGVEMVYDIEVDGLHNFVAEGLIVHNSEMVYHSIQKHLEEKGVIFLSSDDGLRQYPEIYREYFGTVVPPTDNKFAACNTACWSGGSFVYVPKGVKVEMPLQAYFRLNSESTGQFERTLIIIDEGAEAHYVEGCTAPTYSRDSFHSGVIEIIVKKGARMRYTTIQNWSTNVYNLVTQRSLVYEGATMEWVDANLGCLAEGMTVVTPEGVKPIEAVEVGEEVLSFDETIGEMCFRAVTAKRFSGYQHAREVSWGERRIWVTDNHPFYSYHYDPTAPKKLGRYRLGYVRADQLTEAIVPRASLDYGQPYTLAQPSTTTAFMSNNQYAKFEAVREREQRLASPDKTSPELMWLFGLFLGDGHINRQPGVNGGTRYARVGFSTPRDDRAREKLMATMEALMSDAPTERSNGVHLDWNSVELADLFEMNGFIGTARTKRIPEWVFSLPEAQRLSLLAGYLDADGCVVEAKRRLSIRSVNASLLEDVARLATTVGIAARITTEYEGEREVVIAGIPATAHGAYRIDIPIDERLLLYLSDAFRNKAQAVRPPEAAFWRNVGRSSIELPDALEIVPVSVGDPSSEKMPTWDIEVEGTGNFVAEGFIVHNSHLTMKYPSCYLLGEGAHGEILSMAFAGPGQHQDTGGKVIHVAPNTSSKITSKSISMGGGRASYRGLLRVHKGASHVKSNVVCDALLLDPQSRSDTYPYIEIDEDDVNIGHEASVSKVGEDQLFYLMSRGLTEEDATTMVVSGFIEPLVKELPMEYAIEMNRLIQLQMEGSIG